VGAAAPEKLGEMETGICLPYMERDYGRDEILAWCRAVDGGPFSTLSCGERITGYTLEMRTLLSAAAAITERVRIMPSLYVLPMHSAVWAAKEIATLDVLSGGRVTVTVGVGGRPKDYESVGAPFARRHQRMDEQIAEMRRIWQGEPAVEGGDEVGPRPLQTGGPPILAGAMGPKAIRRAAEWAQGIYAFSMSGDATELQRIFDLAEQAWRDAGRSEPPRRVGGFWYSLAPDAETKLQTYVYEYLKYFGDGPANTIARTMKCHDEQAVAESIRAAEAIGCDELMLVPASADIAEIDRAAKLVG
jgi:alkanesulfonate monooxygenase SsuD/methylene tetrahydromethanopterin reductase-like flavin-dependent oxidoreductase (luciferase family)